MHANGEAAAQDGKHAVNKWYSEAAEQGDADAQYNLGLMYDHGLGVAPDAKEAVKWYRLAAEQGHEEAQYQLGVVYDNGKGVAKDTVLAYMWFNISAANGDELGAKNRDLMVKQMTSQEIEKGKAMARICMNSNYQDCGY